MLLFYILEFLSHYILQIFSPQSLALEIAIKHEICSLSILHALFNLPFAFSVLLFSSLYFEFIFFNLYLLIQ